MFAWRCTGSWTVSGHTEGPLELFVILRGQEPSRAEQARGVMFEALVAAAQQEHPDLAAVTVEVESAEPVGRALIPSLSAS